MHSSPPCGEVLKLVMIRFVVGEDNSVLFSELLIDSIDVSNLSFGREATSISVSFGNCL